MDSGSDAKHKLSITQSGALKNGMTTDVEVVARHIQPMQEYCNEGVNVPIRNGTLNDATTSLQIEA